MVDSDSHTELSYGVLAEMAARLGMECEMAKLGDHPGFQAVQAHIASMEHLPMADAGAILAKSSRGASAAAKKKNPRLNRVRGGKKARGSEPMSTDVTSMFKGGGGWK